MATAMVLSGDLTFLSLADLLQMLGGNGANGILRLHTRDSPHPGLVYLRNGNPIHAICGSKAGPDAIYGLFGWLTGSFSFHHEEFNVSQTIQQSRMQIILDGLRMLDDGEVAILGPSGPVRKSRGMDHSIVHGPLVDYMSVVNEERFTAGQQIVEEGAFGSWIWVILEGQVDLLRQTSDGPLKLLTLGEGAFIGNVTAFTIRGHIRNASFVAATDVVLGVLDLQRLSVEYARMSEEMRTVVLSLDRRLGRLTDRLLGCSQGQVEDQKFLETWQPVSLPEDDTDNAVYRITEGHAAVVWKKGKTPILLTRLEPNDVFGRIPFVDIGHEPHSATVLADASLQFVPLDIGTMEAGYNRLSVTFRNIIENLCNAMSVTTNLTVQACTRGMHDPDRTRGTNRSST